MIPFLWYEALQVGGSIAISDVGAGRLNDSNTSNWQSSHIVMVNWRVFFDKACLSCEIGAFFFFVCIFKRSEELV